MSAGLVENLFTTITTTVGQQEGVRMIETTMIHILRDDGVLVGATIGTMVHPQDDEIQCQQMALLYSTEDCHEKQTEDMMMILPALEYPKRHNPAFNHSSGFGPSDRPPFDGMVVAGFFWRKACSAVCKAIEHCCLLPNYLLASIV